MNLFKRSLALALTALALNSIGTAYGQYVDTGTTIQSGSVVVGSGPALGSLISGDGILSPTGFDSLTFNPGSIAIGSGTDTITFNTPGNIIVVNGIVNADTGFSAFVFNTGSQTLTNSGTIQGGIGADNSTGGYGIYINGAGVVTNVTINNSGLIGGGLGGPSAGSDGGDGQDAIYIASETGDMTGISITNTGSILGGAGADSGTASDYDSGEGGSAIYIESGAGNLDNVTLKNSGTIAGGSSGAAAYYSGIGGYGVYLYADEGISGLTINNTGSILGGNSGAINNYYAYESDTAGAALYVYANDGDLSNVTLNNSGKIIGGSAGDVTAVSGGDEYQYGGAGGVGAYFFADDTISSITLNNSGMIAGGNGGSITGNYATETYNGGIGIEIESNGSGGITGLTINNSGSILGGNSGDLTGYLYPDSSYYYTGTGGYGIYVYAESGDIDNTTLNNSGLIAGGNSGSISGSAAYYEDSLAGGAGAQFYADESISNFSLFNSGTIRGGNSGSQTGYYAYYTEAGGDALDVWADANLSGVTINNSGLLAGGNSGNITGTDYYLYSGYGGEGVYIYSDGTMSNVTLNNTGSITGGNSGTTSGYYAYYTFAPGYGVDIYASEGVSNVTVNNSGNILGGNGGPLSTYAGYETDAYSENAGIGVYVYSDDDSVSGLTINNSGLIAGGNSGALTGSDAYVYSGTGGYGVYVYADESISNFSIANSGTIWGGNSGNVDGAYAYLTYEGGDALYVYAASGSISNFSLSNSGLIRGGNSGGTNATDYYTYSYEGGNGLYTYANDGISGFSLNNSGTIAGGNSGNQTGYGAYYAYAGGVGVEVYSDDSNVGNLAINNTGLIQGGNGGSMINPANFFTYEYEEGGDGGTGLYLYAEETLSNASLTNSGRILGGNGGSVSGTYAYEGGDGGTGLYIEATAVNGFTLTNKSGATIQGGNGGNNAQAYYSAGGGGTGIYFDTSSDTNVVFNNSGVIAGGNGGSGGGSQAGGGDGLVAYSSGLTINNWGAISAGAGGGTPTAIYLDGANNTVNLNGHSSVNGFITATSLSNNVLNLDFTGMSPAAQAALKAQLAAQGDLNNFTGTFTVRGVTYNVDPMVIHLDLSSYQAQALTPNETAIGANLDSLTYNPAPGTPFFNLLNAIDQSGNVPGALNALSPQGFAIYGDLAIANSSFLVVSVDARLNNVRNGSESIDTSGIGGDTVAGLTKDDAKESKEIQTAQPKPDRWGFFATGDGLFFRGGNIGQAGRADTAGTVAGVDGKVGDDAIIGALFAYNNTSANLNGNTGHADIQSFTPGIYGSWKDGGFYANGLAAFTRNDYKSTRNILLPGFDASANGSTTSNQYTANLDGGYDWNATSRLAVGPTLGLQYVHMDQFAFNETGAGAGGLALGGEDMNSLQSRLGLHADYHLLTGKYSSGAIDFHAAWQHEYLDDSRSIGASFEGTGLAPFAVQTASPLRDAAVVGAGVNFTFHDRLTLFTEYELELWKASTYEQTISGGARISF